MKPRTLCALVASAALAACGVEPRPYDPLPAEEPWPMEEEYSQNASSIPSPEKCPRQRGRCSNTLGDFPYSFVSNRSNTAIVYGSAQDLVSARMLEASLPSCSSSPEAIPLISSQKLEELGSRSYVISVGNECSNKATAWSYQKPYPSCTDEQGLMSSSLSSGKAVVEVAAVGDRTLFLVYGHSPADTFAAAKIVSDYSSFRKKLESAGLDCASRVVLQGSEILRTTTAHHRR